MIEGTDFGQELSDLMVRGQKLKLDTEASMREVRELVPSDSSDVVTASFDSLGLLFEVHIDSAKKTGMDGRQLSAEINSALLSASELLPAPNYAPASLADALAQSTTQSAFVEDLLSAFSSAATLGAETVHNDLSTVSVVTLLGNVISVDCSPTWLESTPASLIGEEIVRVARIAAMQTDIFGRYTKAEAHD